MTIRTKSHSYTLKSFSAAGSHIIAEIITADSYADIHAVIFDRTETDRITVEQNGTERVYSHFTIPCKFTYTEESGQNFVIVNLRAEDATETNTAQISDINTNIDTILTDIIPQMIADAMGGEQ